jgi:O-antigen/teichoic acid export membrane protein
MFQALMPGISISNSPGLLRSTVQSIATGLGGQLCLLVSGPIVARLLGIDGRGYFAALNAWAIMVATVGALSVPTACTYFISREPTQDGVVIAEAYRIGLVQVFVLTVVLNVLLLLWSRGKPLEVKTAIYPTLLMIPAVLAHRYALAILQGHRRFTAFNLMRLLPVASYAAAVTMLFLLHKNRLFIVVVAWVSTSLLASIVSMAVALKRIRIDWRPQTDFKRRLLQFGLRGHIGAIAPLDNLRLDQLAASIFLAPSALGLYAVAYAFTNLPKFLSQSAGMVAYPEIARRKRSGHGNRLLWRYFWGVTVLNVTVMLALVLAMPFLIPLLFGQQFIASISIAQILLVGATFGASRRILADGLRGLGKPQVSTLSEVSMYPWLLTGGTFLMLRYGIDGVAVAVVIGYALSLAASLAVLKTQMAKPSV